MSPNFTEFPIKLYPPKDSVLRRGLQAPQTFIFKFLKSNLIVSVAEHLSRSFSKADVTFENRKSRIDRNQKSIFVDFRLSIFDCSVWFFGGKPNCPHPGQECFALCFPPENSCLHRRFYPLLTLHLLDFQRRFSVPLSSPERIP